jgi:hypothetical protein
LLRPLRPQRIYLPQAIIDGFIPHLNEAAARAQIPGLLAVSFEPFQ